MTPYDLTKAVDSLTRLASGLVFALSFDELSGDYLHDETMFSS